MARRISQGETDSTLAVVNRAVSVLNYLADHEDASIRMTEIATDLGYSKTATHRILNTLRTKGLVEVDEDTRRYGLGPAIVALAAAYTAKLDVLGASRGEMRALSKATNETVTLSIRRGWQRIYLDQVVPDREVKMSVQIGRSFPLHAGSSSKALLAFLSPDEIDAYLQEPLLPVTELTITDPTELRTELEQVRSLGYAQSFGERQSGASSVAAPIIGAGNRVLAVMSVCGPKERFRDSVESCATALLETTGRLSNRLGHLSPTKPPS